MLGALGGLGEDNVPGLDVPMTFFQHCRRKVREMI